MQSLLISLSRAPPPTLVCPPIGPGCTSTVGLPSKPEGEDTLRPFSRPLHHFATFVLRTDRNPIAATHTGVTVSYPGGPRGAGGGFAGRGSAGGLPGGATDADVAVL